MSGYRSSEHQKKLWEAALKKYGSKEEARKWVAPPGGSAHQSGRAIDFHLGGKNSSANIANLRKAPTYKWLAANAGRFGFYPYAAEPWHWEYNPPAVGQELQLQLTRKIFTAESTIGELSVDGRRECFTLEDAVRPVKIKGKTAIPAGRYEVAITFSNKFQRLLPVLLNVPNFEGVRIHSGNRPKDTEGCILVGRTKAKDFVGESKLAFDALFEKMQAAIKKKKIFVEITDQRQS